MILKNSNPKSYTAIDITSEAIEATKKRLEIVDIINNQIVLNNISDIFNDPSKITKLFGNCLLLIDLGESKFLDKLLLSFN